MLEQASARYLLASVLLIGGCVTTPEGTSSPSSPTTAAPSPTESTSPTQNPSPTEAAASTVQVSIPVAFSISVPGDWEQDEAISSSTTYGFKVGIDRWVVFTGVGPDTVEGWVEQLTSNASLTVSEPEVVDLNGAPGVTVDLTLNEGEDEVALIREGWGEWTLSPDRPNQIWVVEVGGEVVLIVTDAPAQAFDSWVATVGDVLNTIAWSE